MSDNICKIPRKRQSPAGQFLSFSLAEEVDRLKRQPEWEAGSRSSTTLVKSQDLSVVLVALRKGGAICGHKVEEPITVLTLSGTITFRAGRQSKTLKADGLASL